MSKLSEHLKLYQTGKVLPDRNRKLKLTSRFEVEPPANDAPGRKVYRVGAELGCRVVVSGYDSMCIDAVGVAFEQARELLVNEVFGEFRQPLYEIMEHLLGDDVDAARRGLHDLMHQMFDV